MCPHTGSMFNLTLLRVGNYCLLTREITFCNYDYDCELTAAKSVLIAKICTLPIFAILIVIPSHSRGGQFCALAMAITITKISNVNRPLISAIQSINQSVAAVLWALFRKNMPQNSFAKRTTLQLPAGHLRIKPLFREGNAGNE